MFENCKSVKSTQIIQSVYRVKTASQIYNLSAATLCSRAPAGCSPLIFSFISGETKALDTSEATSSVFSFVSLLLPSAFEQ